MAQSSQRSYGGANRGGMGSLFAGIMEGWDGVSKIFDDIGVVQREREFKDKAADQEAKDLAAKGKAAAGSTKLSTALLESGDTGSGTTTQTGQAPYTGPKLAGQVTIEAIPTGAAPAGGPSGTASPTPGPKVPDGKPDPWLLENAPVPTQTNSVGLGYPPGSTTGAPAAGYPPPQAGGFPPPAAAAAAAPAAPPAAAAEVPPDDTDPASAEYGGGSDKGAASKIPTFGPQPAQPQSQVASTQALPTGAGVTIGARTPYADAALGQSLLGLGATAGRRRGLGGPDFAEEQQALPTAPPAARRAQQRPRQTQMAAIPNLLPQVDLFGNPIVPPGVRSV